MAALGSQSIASSFEQLLHVDADGGGNGTTHVSVKDGDNGTTFGFTIATDALMMTGTNRLEFGDTGTYIHQSADGVLDLVSDTELELNATTIDMNGAVDISGDTTSAGNLTLTKGDASNTLIFNANLSSAADNIAFLKGNWNNTTVSQITLFSGPSTSPKDDGGIAFATKTTTQSLAERMRIDTVGNVGIGDSDPSEAKLSIDNVQSGDAGIKIHNDQATSGIEIDQDGNNSAIYIDAENTSANSIEFQSDALTSGKCALFSSNSSDNSSRSLVEIINDSSSATGAKTLRTRNDANVISVVHDCERSDYSQAGMMQLNANGRSGTANFVFLKTFTGGDSDDQHRLRGDGATLADGAYDSGGADYAEYFESKNGSALAIGTTVKLDGEKIVACEDGDNPIGVIRPNGKSTTIGNSSPLKWQGKYLMDDYGAYIMEEFTITEWIENTDIIKKEAIEEVLYVEGDDIPEGKEIGDVKIEAEDAVYETKDVQYHTDKIPSDVNVPSDAIVISEEEDGSKLMRKKLNPDYDSSINYIPREERDEWNIVGLLGQIEITKGQPTSINWIKMKDISETVELWFVK